MENVTVLLARASAWVEPTDLNPRGAVFYPALVDALVERYGFLKYPRKPEDFDESKGVTFADGRFKGAIIEQFVIFTYALLLDTRVSTQESKRLLEEALEWSSTLGINYKPGMVKRWNYLSQLTFTSKAPFTETSPALGRLADRVTKQVGEITGEALKYELAIVAIDHDPLVRKHLLGRFSIQRRENTPFSEGRYFSDAPLHTDSHIKLLEQFESEISR